jgi:hypothetical protein
MMKHYVALVDAKAAREYWSVKPIPRTDRKTKVASCGTCGRTIAVRSGVNSGISKPVGRVSSIRHSKRTSMMCVATVPRNTKVEFSTGRLARLDVLVAVSVARNNLRDPVPAFCARHQARERREARPYFAYFAASGKRFEL